MNSDWKTNRSFTKFEGNEYGLKKKKKKKATSLANKQDLRFPSVYQPKMKII